MIMLRAMLRLAMQQRVIDERYASICSGGTGRSHRKYHVTVINDELDMSHNRHLAVSYHLSSSI